MHKFSLFDVDIKFLLHIMNLSFPFEIQYTIIYVISFLYK